MEPEIKVGTFTSAGTPAAVNVDCGFLPDFVRLIIGADTNPNVYEYHKDLGDTKTVLMTGSSGVLTYETSNPIVQYDSHAIGTTTVMGTSGVVKDTGYKGFTVPAALQVASKVNYWIAMRQGA